MRKGVCYLLAVAVIAVCSGCGTRATRGPRGPLSDDITLVYITDQTIREIGSFPLTRDRYGAFIDAVYGGYAPKCVYIDLLITTPSKETPEGDECLAESVAGKKDLAFCSAVGKTPVNHPSYSGSSVTINGDPAAVKSQGGHFPLPELTSNGALVAISSIFSNHKGLMDSFPTVLDIAGDSYLSTPLLLSMLYLDMPRSTLSGGPGALTVQGRSVTVDGKGQFAVDFGHSFRTCTYADVLSKRAPRDLMDGKIVMLGVAYTGAGDFLATPAGTRVQGTEYAAHATQTLVDLLRSTNTGAQPPGGR